MFAKKYGVVETGIPLWVVHSGSVEIERRLIKDYFRDLVKGTLGLNFRTMYFYLFNVRCSINYYFLNVCFPSNGWDFEKSFNYRTLVTASLYHVRDWKCRDIVRQIYFDCKRLNFDELVRSCDPTKLISVQVEQLFEKSAVGVRDSTGIRLLITYNSRDLSFTNFSSYSTMNSHGPLV